MLFFPLKKIFLIALRFHYTETVENIVSLLRQQA